MIQNGFFYVAVLIFIAGILVNLPHVFTGKIAKKIFNFFPPVVLLYLGLMFLCTIKLWDLEATKSTYVALQKPLLYAMIFLMLLRCDLKKIIKLGKKMLIVFFAASFSISLGFVVTYAIMHGFLGEGTWKILGALCGAWLGGTGNMLAIQNSLNIDETSMAYALIIDSFIGSLYIMFLLFVVDKKEKFNKWTKADCSGIDSICKKIEKETAENKKPLLWQNIIFLLGLSLIISAVCPKGGTLISTYLTFFDESTWTVLIVTLLGIIGGFTSLGKIRGSEEVSNVMLYIIIAFIASRADLGAMGNAFVWIIAGVMILVIHVVVMVILAKLLKMDSFTCSVASLANIGGTATAPILASVYSNALVPVGIIMALLGYVIGTFGGLITAHFMSFFG